MDTSSLKHRKSGTSNAYHRNGRIAVINTFNGPKDERKYYDDEGKYVKTVYTIYLKEVSKDEFDAFKE